MAIMHRLAALWLVVATAFVATEAAGNKYPIVLVHGFAGWGRGELGGIPYWGGFHGDWQEQLKAQGYDVRTAAVGPLSSNWDRACELYAYIKGGTVNYGANHARTHGHNVTGRTFPGLFPQWGEVVNGTVQKIHIITHSMGGQTARMLAQLLAQGTKGAPIPEDPNSHPLFAGGKDWIHSITTAAGVHQGTTLADGIDMLNDTVENLVTALIGTLDAFGDGFSKLWDAKFDQWNLTARGKDENIKDYLKRIFASPVLHNAGKDLCVYSLSTVGAKEELTWVKTLPNIYYYSFSNQDTFRIGNIALPRPLSMLLPLQPISTFIGSTFTTKKMGKSEDWLMNDGAVNTPSMRSDGIAPVVEGVAQSMPGRWHHIGLFKTLDHEAMVGVKPFVNIFDVYAAQAKILYELPATKTIGQSRFLRTAPETHTHSEEASRRVSEAVEMVNELTAPKEDDAVAFCANVRRLTDTKPETVTLRRLCDEHMRTL